MRLSRVVPLLAVIASLAFAAPALGASGGGGPVIADCYAHLKLTRSYSTAQLEDALRAMPADVAEYSDCQDVIHRALLTAEGKLHGSGGTITGSTSGGSFLPTPVIVVLVVLLLAAATFGGLALRRRRAV